MFNLSNILNATNYEGLCDYSIVPPYGKNFTSEILTRNATIFCKTDYIEYLFDHLKESNYNYNLVTHHSDYPIDSQRWSLKPKCIKKWFAINPIIDDTNLIAVPLGLKTHKQPYLEPRYMTEWFAYNIERLRSNKKKKNIYCNWNQTNESRNFIKDSLISKKISITYQHNIPFNEYIEEMSQHKFVISPPGNGIDCHRTWEAIYIGCIPIVIKHPIYNDWNLPIIQVNNYSELTQDFLDSYLLYDNNYNELNLEYWRERIIKI